MSCDACKWPRSCAADGCWRAECEAVGLPGAYETWSGETSRKSHVALNAPKKLPDDAIEQHRPLAEHQFPRRPMRRSRGAGPAR